MISKYFKKRSKRKGKPSHTKLKINLINKGSKKKARKQEAKKRKNFLPTLIIAIFLWVGVALFINSVNPYSFGALQLLLIIIFVASFFTFSLLFANTRRGFISATFLVMFLALRYLGIGNIVNLSLLAGLFITIEMYFSKN